MARMAPAHAHPATERMGRSLGQTGIVLNRDNPGGRKCPRSPEEPDTGDTEFQDPSVYSSAQYCDASIGRSEAPASASPALRIPATPELLTIAAERLTMGELRPDSTGWQGQGMLDRWIDPGRRANI